MAKKVCEFCGAEQYITKIQGVRLCGKCVDIYYSPDLNVTLDTFDLKPTTLPAIKLFSDKADTLPPVYETEAQKEQAIRMEQERLLAIQRQKEIQDARIEYLKKEQEKTDIFLKSNGHEGYYEYKVIGIVDEINGSINVEQLMENLNYWGRQGWHLRCAFTNELGKNATSIGVAGVSFGTNSTADQSVLILERFIKFQS